VAWWLWKAVGDVKCLCCGVVGCIGRFGNGERLRVEGPTSCVPKNLKGNEILKYSVEDLYYFWFSIGFL
jgi:hypothetical protein